MIKLTAKKYRHFNIGHEGGAMSCELYVDGVLAAHVENDGTGSSNKYTWVGPYEKCHSINVPADIAAHVEAQPEVDYHGYKMKPNLDMLVDDACYDFQMNRKLTIRCKKVTVFRFPTDPKDHYREYAKPFTPAIAAAIRAKHPNVIIINETLGA